MVRPHAHRPTALNRQLDLERVRVTTENMQHEVDHSSRRRPENTGVNESAAVAQEPGVDELIRMSDQVGRGGGRRRSEPNSISRRRREGGGGEKKRKGGGPIGCRASPFVVAEGLMRWLSRVCAHPTHRHAAMYRAQDPASRLQEVESEIERVRALQAALHVPKAGPAPNDDEVMCCGRKHWLGCIRALVVSDVCPVPHAQHHKRFSLLSSLTSRPFFFALPSTMLQPEAGEAVAEAGGAEGGYDT